MISTAIQTRLVFDSPSSPGTSISPVFLISPSNYWVGQKVCQDFSITSYAKKLNELFGQPNTSLNLFALPCPAVVPVYLCSCSNHPANVQLPCLPGICSTQNSQGDPWETWALVASQCSSDKEEKPRAHCMWPSKCASVSARPLCQPHSLPLCDPGGF